MKRLLYLVSFGAIFIASACQNEDNSKEITVNEKVIFADPEPAAKQEGMVWIPGGKYTMGSNDPAAYEYEKPAVQVAVKGFWMDKNEVTNAEFARFVQETGYITLAERPVDWEELKKQLPTNTPKPADSLLLPGSLVFFPPARPVPTDDINRWWKWVTGANWKHPEGPGSDLTGRENHPVVHIAYDDAVAFAEWAGKRLPSELEWEFAARGGVNGKRFAWGDELTPEGKHLANTFQGTFPHQNLGEDGFIGTSPVASFEPNPFGLYDMIGNVWELTSDWYDALKHARLAGQAPKLDAGMNPCYNPNNPFAQERVIKGGSYLCAANYCVNYRPSARQGQAFDSGTSNVGFRLVKDANHHGMVNQ